MGGQPPQRVPTLTEVVTWPESSSVDAAVTPPAEAPHAEADLMGAAMLHALMVNEEQITQRVLAELQRQVELMLEYRLREVLTPLLTRATDNLIRETRTELASTLRDLVARAVAQEIARHRSG